MRLTRIWIPEALLPGAAVELPEQQANHVARVLRLVVGDTLCLFDGRGGEHSGVIAEVGKRRVRVQLQHFQPLERESSLATTLLLGISRSERMDMALQKATELGVTRIQPLITRRSTVKLDEANSLRKHAHWHGVVVGACEQSGRTRLPELLPTVTVQAACAGQAQGLRLVLDVEGAMSLPACLAAARADGQLQAGVTLLVGPEGGLDDAEIASATRQGFKPCLLGPRVLRTETAPLAALAALQVLAGDWR
jgi:16S rRNA (uracil1498-N3)-methyltransferase